MIETQITRKVHLYGVLADIFTDQPIELASASAPDLLLALRSIFPKWRGFIQDNPQLIFALSGDNKSDIRGIEADFIKCQFGNATEVHVFPAMDGAGIEVAAYLGITSVVGAFVVNTIASVFISMALGALAQALSPSTSTSAGSPNAVDQAASFIYNGAVNVQEQGGPVPIIYGYFMGGSTVVSSAVDVEQLLYTPAQSVPPANGGGTAQPSSPPAVAWQWSGVTP